MAGHKHVKETSSLVRSLCSTVCRPISYLCSAVVEKYLEGQGQLETA